MRIDTKKKYTVRYTSYSCAFPAEVSVLLSCSIMSDAYALTTEVVWPGVSSASALANEKASAIVSSRTCRFHNARNDIPRSRALQPLLVDGNLGDIVPRFVGASCIV